MQAQQPHPDSIWNTLPVEVKLQILSYLPPEQLANVHQVSHQMDQLATEVDKQQIAEWTAAFRDLRERIDLITSAMDIEGVEDEFGEEGAEGQLERLSNRLSEYAAQATDYFGAPPEQWAQRPAFADLYAEWSAAAGTLAHNYS